MKKFLSVLIALILVLSMFSVTAIAFADDNDSDTTVEHKDVTFNDAKFKEEVFDKFSFDIEMSKTFMLNTDWLYDANLVRTIFPGINWFAWPKEDLEGKETEYTLKYDLGEYADLNKGYYCEIDNEFFQASELVDGKCPNYSDEDHANGGNVQLEEKVLAQYQDALYLETKHVKLASAPKAEEGKQFDGWTITFEGQDEWRVGRLYKAGEEIAMPAAEVTVKANWSDVVEDGEEEDGASLANEDDLANAPEDHIYVLYVGPNSTADSKQEMKNWGHCEITSNLSLTDAGYWSFRFAVVNGYADNDTFSYDNVLATSYDNVLNKIKEQEEAGRPLDKEFEKECSKVDYTLVGSATDTTHPVVDLSEAMKDKADEGLTVGKTYAISTVLEVDDASGYSATYEVYKKVGNVEGADEDGWLLIFDSKLDSGERVTEGYENCISENGVITPLASDVTGEAIYRIVYTVEDDYGWYGVEVAGGDVEFHPTLELRVYPANSTGSSAVDAWKVVLYVIAGLSAVGIVVLLFIKPKQQTASVEDGRYNASANAEDDANDSEQK